MIRPAFAFLLVLNFAPFAAAAPCSCKNLESLQQETENARYEAQFFADLANRLKAFEGRQIEVNKDPANPDSGKSVLVASAQERQRIMASEFRLPHGQVKDYTGPASVDMEPLTCSQKPADLAGLQSGAPCDEIGAISVAHETRHAADCEAMGAEAYWARLPSVIAAEEAARYAEQAKAMEDLLKGVIDKGTLTVEAVLTPTYSAQGFTARYSHTISKMELKGHSSGAPEWALMGNGRQISRLEHVQIVGMSCTPSGELIEDAGLTARTDGFSLSLAGRMKYVSGQIKIKCRKGMGMSGFQPGEAGAGSYFEAEPFRPEMSMVRDVSTMAFAQIVKSGGINVTGEERVTVKLECPGE